MGLLSIDDDAFNLVDYPKEKGSPERRLLLAILERAILDYVGNDPEEYETAKDWLFEDEQGSYLEPFTFGWVCQQLDLDKKQIAGMVRKMPRRGKNRVAPWYFAKGHFLDDSNARKAG